ncbi:cupredoxin domain-containing protein, partial [bacterium]|nr:cupredoxin domain-containing protein [bacterium]
MYGKIFLVFLFLLGSATGLLAAVGVSVEDNFFTPSNITVPIGTTIIWTHNGRNLHTVTSGSPDAPSGLFDSGNMSSGQTFQFTFNSPGTIPYYCRIHGASMTGTITVVCPTKSQLLKNPGFENGNVSWVPSMSGIINSTTAFPPRSGSWKAQLNGKGSTNTQSVYQQIAIPANACTATLTFYVRIATTETASVANDKLKIQILDSAGGVLKTLKTFSNLDKTTGYVKKSFSVLNFNGKTIRVRFL